MITNHFINELKNYFSAKENLTEQEKGFLTVLTSCDDEFPITSVTRHDLAAKGFKAEEITDDQMDRLADRMGDDFCSQLFWESLENLSDYLGFPRTDEDEEE